MKQEMSCPLCKEEIYSGVGIGCMMCGMPLENKNKKFCSATCRTKYKRINKFKFRRKTR